MGHFFLANTRVYSTQTRRWYPARNARNVVTLAEVTFVTIQRENILPSKITDYWLTNAHELLTTEWLKY
jgi:hypothetical protein